MDNPWDWNEHKAPAAVTLPSGGPLWPSESWDDIPPPPIEHLLEGWLARGSGGIMAGEGGTGKSLLGQMLCSCVALGRPFLGYQTQCAPAAYITCEDDQHVLRIRQVAINQVLGVKMADYGEFLTLWSLKGRIGNELGVFDATGRIEPTDLFEEISNLGSELTCLDNASHFFPGNENVRHEVATFCNMLDRLAMRNNGVVLLLAHTPKNGAEYSGSTGWDAHVRQRLYLSHADQDQDTRILTRSKSNYSRRGEKVSFRWYHGAFVRDEDLPPETLKDLANTAKASAENAAFMRCLEAATERSRAVSHNPGSNYAPKVFAAMPEGKSFNQDAFKSAMERLLSLGAITLDQPLWRGPNRVMKQGIKATEICTDPPAQTPCTDLHETRGNAARFNPPYTTYNGAALEAAAPITEIVAQTAIAHPIAFDLQDPADALLGDAA